MARRVGWLVILLAVLLAAPAARARGAAKKAKADEFTKMADALGLDGDARAEFEEAVDAAKAKVKDADDALAAEIKLRQAERRKLKNEVRAAVLAGLTPEQKKKWAGHQLSKRVLRLYRTVDLTDEQTAKVRGICLKAAAELGDDPGRAAKGAATRKVHRAITETVLTKEQQKAFAEQMAKWREAAKKRAKPAADKPKAE